LTKKAYNKKWNSENRKILKWVNFVRRLGFGTVEVVIDKPRDYFRVKVHTEDRDN